MGSTDDRLSPRGREGDAQEEETPALDLKEHEAFSRRSTGMNMDLWS